MRKMILILAVLFLALPAAAQIGGHSFDVMHVIVTTVPITVPETSGTAWDYTFYDGWAINNSTWNVVVTVVTSSTTQTCLNFSSAGKIMNGEMVKIDANSTVAVDMKGRKCQNFSVMLSTHGVYIPASPAGTGGAIDYIPTPAAINDKVHGYIRYYKD